MTEHINPDGGSPIPHIHPVEDARAMRAVHDREPDMQIEVWVTDSGNLASVGLKGSHFMPLDTTEDVQRMSDTIVEASGAALNLVAQVGPYAWPSVPVGLAVVTRQGFKTALPASFWVEEQQQPFSRRMGIAFWAIRQAWGAVLPIFQNALRLMFKRPLDLGEED